MNRQINSLVVTSAIALGACTTAGAAAPVEDRAYDSVERTRGAAFRPSDTSYGVVEGLRGQIVLSAGQATTSTWTPDGPFGR
jgi:hypothetical protein